MKVTEVPQDQDPSYLGETKLCYAVDEHGKIVPVQTTGWKAEETVKALAWHFINEDLDQTKQAVQAGRASPLLYFMKYRQMDRTLLAQNMGISRWRVWWHLRPRVFARLSEQWIDRYAECLEIPATILRSYRGQDAN